jgi:hypothetical protein
VHTRSATRGGRANAAPAGWRTIDAPAITWATRSAWRRVGSRVVCPLLARRWRAHDIVRVAVHPHDLDHPATVRSIEAVLAGLRRDRQVVPIT